MDLQDQILPAINACFETDECCTEHQLISHLKDAGIEPFNLLDIRQSKDLFCAHFLLRHALYQLQDSYHEAQSYCLKIELTRIERQPFLAGSYNLCRHDPLKAYYQDIRHYFETGEQEVDDLLNNFWRKYLAQDDKLKALQVFGLQADSTYENIKKRYRTLAQKHHPDKGGCPKQFAEIAAAKAVLDTLYS